MKTKPFFISFLVAVLFMFIIISCKKNQQAEPAPYIVEAATDSILNGKMAYLYDLGSDRLLDSILVHNNKIAFKGIVDTVRYSRIYVENDYADFILDTGKIIVNMKEHNASNTPLNTALTAYNGQMSKLYKGWFELNEELERKHKNKSRLKTEVDSIFRNVFYPKVVHYQNEILELNANNIVGAIVLDDMSGGSTGMVDSAIAKLSKDIRTLNIADRVVKRNEAMKKTDVGQEFIDFTIEQPDGTKVSLSDYVGKGKYVLVDFWASWCGPCRGEIPNLRELYKKYKGDKFEIVGVAVIDEIKDTQKAIEEDKVEWPQILDSKEVPMRIYGIRSIPHIMLIGPDGTILARNLRGEDMIARITKELN